jgi:hypothetical protein
MYASLFMSQERDEIFAESEKQEIIINAPKDGCTFRKWMAK